MRCCQRGFALTIWTRRVIAPPVRVTSVLKSFAHRLRFLGLIFTACHTIIILTSFPCLLSTTLLVSQPIAVLVQHQAFVAFNVVPVVAVEHSCLSNLKGWKAGVEAELGNGRRAKFKLITLLRVNRPRIRIENFRLDPE